jgi:hypothetical protein
MAIKQQHSDVVKGAFVVVASSRMSYIGRGSYLAAAVAGVASAFYIFEPEFIALKHQREASAVQIPAHTPSSESNLAGTSPSPAPAAASGRWQKQTSQADGRVYWMNLDTGANHSAAH